MYVLLSCVYESEWGINQKQLTDSTTLLKTYYHREEKKETHKSFCRHSQYR